MHWRGRAYDRGRLIGVGVGPGDPELLTLKAARILAEADVVAHFAKAGNASNARRIVAQHLRPGVEELPLLYPVTTEIPTARARRTATPSAISTTPPPPRSPAISMLAALSPSSAKAIRCSMAPTCICTCVSRRATGSRSCRASPPCPAAGRSPARRLRKATMCSSYCLRRCRRPNLSAALLDADAAVVMKLGRHLEKVRRVLTRTGRLARAIYVERGTTAESVSVPLDDKARRCRAVFLSDPGAWLGGKRP